MQALVTLYKNAQHIVVFTGAGMSTDSGLPDFRSKDRGLWEEFNPDELANVNALLHNTKKFTDFYRHRLRDINQYKPHEGHFVLAELEHEGKLHGIITQNVDGFHRDAGNKNIMELHGSFANMHCHHCGRSYERQDYLAGQYTCDCGGTIRPGIVLFGEMLPEKAFHDAEIAASKADLFIVLGSSLTVSPANMFPLVAKENDAKLVIINREPTDYDHFADLVIQNLGIKDALLQLKQGLK